MSRLSLDTLRHDGKSLPTRLTVTSIILPIFAGILGWLVPIGISPSNGRLFLTALVGAQASVLAIVFSVTLLGIQLATTRYATRMIHLFVESVIFRFTLLIFLVSIAVDLIALYNLPPVSTRLAVASMFFASGFGVVAALSLTAFIPRILQLGTPDGLIEEFESRLPPEEYLEQSRQFRRSGARGDHPLQPLHALTMAAVSRQEWATAERGLSGFQSILSGTVDQLSQTGDIPRQMRDPVVDAMFELPLQEFLSEISLHAMENDERELARQAMNIQGETGKLALEHDRRHVAPLAVRGLRNTIIDTPATMEGSTVYRYAFRQAGEIAEAIADRPDPYELRSVLRSIDHRVDAVLWQDVEHWVFEDFLLHYFDGTLLRIQELLLGYYGEYLQLENIDWHRQRAPDDLANRQLFEAFFTWRETFINTSRRILAFRERNGEYPITYGNYFSSWQRACEQAVNAGAEEYASTMIKAMIETAYIGSQIDEDSMGTWTRRLAHLMEEGDKSLVEQALNDVEVSGQTELVNYIPDQRGGTPSGPIGAVRNWLESPASFEEWNSVFARQVRTVYREHYTE